MTQVVTKKEKGEWSFVAIHYKGDRDIHFCGSVAISLGLCIDITLYKFIIALSSSLMQYWRRIPDILFSYGNTVTGERMHEYSLWFACWNYFLCMLEKIHGIWVEDESVLGIVTFFGRNRSENEYSCEVV